MTVECAGAEFAAKGRTVKQLGWRALDAAYRAGLKNAEPDKEIEDKALPELSEGQTLPLSGAAVKEGKTTPPKHFTEDSLLAAMETAGKGRYAGERRAQGPGDPSHPRRDSGKSWCPPASWSAKRVRKPCSSCRPRMRCPLSPCCREQLQSPFLTAEWEYRLGEIERGELSPEDFMAGISAMLQELVRTYQVIKGTEYLFTPAPRGGGQMPPLRRRSCRNSKKASSVRQNLANLQFGKNNKWWELKRKQPTKAIVTALLKDGCAHVQGLYSEKTGKTYDATVMLEDDGKYANFKLAFDRQKGGKR